MKITINNHLCGTLDEVREFAPADVASFIEEWENVGDYVVAHTSGSTGEPKEVHLLKSDMRASAQLTNDFFKLNEESLFYLCLSPSYIAGKMMIVRALELGASIWVEKPSNQPMAEFDCSKRVSLLAVVPSQVKYLLNNPEKLQVVDAMIVGGGKLAPRWEHWLAEYGVNAYLTYGMTETCSHVALASVSRTDCNPFKALGEVRFSTDDRDCLVIDAPQFASSHIVTNDVVNLMDDNRFVWLGRYDNVINSGGVKVHPEEVERKLASLFPNIRFYITSVSSEKWGEEVAIAFEYSSLPEGTVKRGDVQPALIEKMKQLLPAYSVPRKYVAVKHFAETSSGKIKRLLH